MRVNFFDVLAPTLAPCRMERDCKGIRTQRRSGMGHPSQGRNPFASFLPFKKSQRKKAMQSKGMLRSALVLAALGATAGMALAAGSKTTTVAVSASVESN